MSVYAISDLHLSINSKTNKSMDVFGARWSGYVQKLRKNWEAIVTAEDTVIVPGDISWAMTLEEALPDFQFLESLPGTKIIGKEHICNCLTAEHTTVERADDSICFFCNITHAEWL